MISLHLDSHIKTIEMRLNSKIFSISKMNSKIIILLFVAASSRRNEFGEALGRAGRDLLYWNRMGNRFSNPRLNFRSNAAYITQVCSHLQKLTNENYSDLPSICKINQNLIILFVTKTAHEAVAENSAGKLRLVQTQAICFFNSMPGKIGSDI